MSPLKNKIVGFLSRNTNQKLPAICLATNANVMSVAEALEELQCDGTVKGRGYAAHTEEYYLAENPTIEQLGEMITRKQGADVDYCTCEKYTWGKSQNSCDVCGGYPRK